MVNPLIKLMVGITRHPREVVTPSIDFEWSNKLWVHNVFRAYEIVFGRRTGIRAGTSVAVDANGRTTLHFHTWEDMFAQSEIFLRSLFHVQIKMPVMIRLPIFATALGGPMNLPYRFAIAFDATAGTGSPPSNTTSPPYNHTCTGSNLTLVVGAQKNAVAADNITACTYNSVSMTLGVTFSASTYNVVEFYLPSPATGSHAVSAGPLGNASNWTIASVSLTGTASAPVSPGSNSATGSSASPSVSVTTSATNSWVTAYCWQVDNPFGGSVTGTNQTQRNAVSDTASGFSAAISTQTTTAPGAYISSWSITSTLWVNVGLEIQAGAGAVINSGFFFKAVS